MQVLACICMHAWKTRLLKTCHTFFSVFNIYAGKSVVPGTFIAIWINGIRTDLVMTINSFGIAEFEGGILRPSVQQLRALHLQEGRNLMEIRAICPRTLTVVENDQMSTTADLWLWDREDEVAVVDIDGTITKSDVRGFVATGIQGAVSDTAAFLFSALSMSDRDIDRTRQSILPTALSKDYVHEGVSEAISFLAQIGCRIFYLTARPITWVGMTRSFLLSVGRGSGARIPEGAVVTIEHSTARAFISVSHEEFKTRVLNQISALFAPVRLEEGAVVARRVPFVAGFGNHMSDVNAYASAGIPQDRIFLIDRTSKITSWGTKCEYQSYRGLLPALQDIFAAKAFGSARPVEREVAGEVRGASHQHEAAPSASPPFHHGSYSPREGRRSPAVAPGGLYPNGIARPADGGRASGWLGNVISSCGAPRREGLSAQGGYGPPGGEPPARPAGYDDNLTHSAAARSGGNAAWKRATAPGHERSGAVTQWRSGAAAEPGRLCSEWGGPAAAEATGRDADYGGGGVGDRGLERGGAVPQRRTRGEGDGLAPWGDQGRGGRGAAGSGAQRGRADRSPESDDGGRLFML